MKQWNGLQFLCIEQKCSHEVCLGLAGERNAEKLGAGQGRSPDHSSGSNKQ